MNSIRAATIVALLASCATTAGAQTLSYVQPLSQAGTAAVQQRLKETGAYSGRTDGIWGRESALSLERYQRSQGVPATGQLNQATAGALGINPADVVTPAVGAAAVATLPPEDVRNIQSRLRALGFYAGSVDGIWGPSMQTALERFQQGRGLQVTGQLNPATINALGLDPGDLARPIR